MRIEAARTSTAANNRGLFAATPSACKPSSADPTRSGRGGSAGSLTRRPGPRRNERDGAARPCIAGRQSPCRAGIATGHPRYPGTAGRCGAAMGASELSIGAAGRRSRARRWGREGDRRARGRPRDRAGCPGGKRPPTRWPGAFGRARVGPTSAPFVSRRGAMRCVASGQAVIPRARSAGAWAGRPGLGRGRTGLRGAAAQRAGRGRRRCGHRQSRQLYLLGAPAGGGARRSASAAGRLGRAGFFGSGRPPDRASAALGRRDVRGAKALPRRRRAGP